MSKQSKADSGNMLLLAGLGVGALMLFANKGQAQNKTAQTTGDDSSDDADIPAAPKILAVNSNASESPLPTGIVSDEEGMEATASSQTRQSNGTDESEEQGNDASANSGIVPPLISTKLTPKEKTIISKGVLSNDLALQRPDLYKAIYIKKNGGKGNSQKALQAADAIIARIQTSGATKATATQKKKRRVAIRLHPQAGSMIKAAQAAGNTGIVKPSARTTHPALKHPATPHPSSKQAQRKVTKQPAGKKQVISTRSAPAHRKHR